MGRWAQRRRGGGGGGPTIFIVIVTATFDTGFTIDLGYSTAVDDTDFDPADFITDPDFFVPTAIAQNGVAGLRLTFTDDISGQGSITYSGTTPHVQSPQNIGIV